MRWVKVLDYAIVEFKTRAQGLYENPGTHFMPALGICSQYEISYPRGIPSKLRPTNDA